MSSNFTAKDFHKWSHSDTQFCKSRAESVYFPTIASGITYFID